MSAHTVWNSNEEPKA